MGCKMYDYDSPAAMMFVDLLLVTFKITKSTKA